jgi:arginase
VATDVAAFLVPYHLASLRQGTGAGPEALVAAGALAGIPTANVQTIIAPAAANEVHACVTIDTALAVAARAARQSGAIPLVLSGNCHSCLGTLAATGPDVSIVWFDAHGDLNTPNTTETGFFDGMALASAIGWAWRSMVRRIPGFQPVREEHVLLAGGRDLDPAERDLVSRSRVRHFMPPALRSDDETAAAFADALTSASSPRATYVHIDLDVLDVTELRANRYASAGGVSVGWLETALRTIRSRKEIAAVAVTSYDPECHDVREVSSIVNRLTSALF